MACNCVMIPASNFQLPPSLRTTLFLCPSAFPATQFTSPATRLPRSNSQRSHSLLPLIVLHRHEPCSNTYHTASLLTDCMACNCPGYLLPTSNFSSHNFVCLSERLSSYLIHQSNHSVTKVAHTTVELSADADCTPSIRTL